MADEHQPWMLLWLRANVVASVTLIISILSTSGWALVTASRWITSHESRIDANASEIAKAEAAIAELHHDIIDVDRRLNAERDRMMELHNQSDAADAELRSRLTVIDALAKLTADRAFQPALPPPYTPKGQPR
jgi:peptidoglycan hydrolase CwlO-like protein